MVVCKHGSAGEGIGRKGSGGGSQAEYDQSRLDRQTGIYAGERGVL